MIGQYFSYFYSDKEIWTDKPREQLIQAIQNGRVEDQGWRVWQDGFQCWADVVIRTNRPSPGFTKIVRDGKQTEKICAICPAAELPLSRFRRYWGSADGGYQR
jgi:hypothetical protein